MSDLIDRQELLRQIDIDAGDEPGYYGDTWKFIDTIKNMPSATDISVGDKLGTNLAEVGTDCISRQAAIGALGEKPLAWEQGEYEEGLQTQWESDVEAIKALPPAQPEIIRCKDCKHWIPYDWMFSEIWQSRNMADYPEDEMGCNWCDMAMKADDFCSRAERREVTT